MSDGTTTLLTITKLSAENAALRLALAESEGEIEALYGVIMDLIESLRSHLEGKARG